MKKRIIAVNSNCYHGFSIEDAIAGIRDAGFHYIELTATKGWTEHVFPDQSFARLLEVQRMLEANDLVPFAMSGHTNLMDPEREQDFRNNIRLAKFFGADYIVSSIGEAHLKDNTIASNEVTAERIRNLVPELEKLDMKLVLEVRITQSAAQRGRMGDEPTRLFLCRHCASPFSASNASSSASKRCRFTFTFTSVLSIRS